MPTPDVDVVAMVQVLLDHEVDFVIIGGFAIELHAVPVPPTRDVDITPARSDANLSRLAGALTSLDAKLRMPGEATEGLEIPGGWTAELLKEMVTVTLITTAGPLDISFLPDGTTGYDDLHENSVLVSFGDLYLRVASLNDVIRSKEAAGREKDLIVLPALREHARRSQR
ncbi:MAG TPA: hypothetical protein VM470_10050 [Acidimicrobiia bacterium]|nr:hypothetical protein [Acidimicrobiia bacterium]